MCDYSWTYIMLLQVVGTKDHLKVCFKIMGMKLFSIA